MKISRIIITVIFLFVAELIISSCDCPEPRMIRYTYCSLSLENLDNSGAQPIVPVSDSIKKEAFGLRLLVGMKEDFCYRRSYSLFSMPAYATSVENDCPVEFEFEQLDTIISLNIYSLNDFDDTHPAGSDVTGYFKILERDYLLDLEDGMKYLFYYDPDNPTLELNLLLMTPPAIAAENQFEVEIILSSGRVLSDVSEKVNLI